MYRKLNKFHLLALLLIGAWSTVTTLQAQTVPANTKIEILGTGNSALLLSPLTDPNNDGLDAAGGATDPSWDWLEATASIEPDFEGGENAFNVFDHKVDAGGNDKWCCDAPTDGNPVWVAVKLKQAVSLTYFTVTSGNDTPARDPLDWAIQGSNDGVTYTDIFHQTSDTSLWGDVRFEVIKFTLPAPSPTYQWIRYICYLTGTTAHQISEIEYYGIVGGATQVDTDKDGMPDDWEIAHGLNPNDPTDAAKDCNGNGLTNLQEYNLGFDPCDTTKPVVVSATPTATFDTVKIAYSLDMDPTTATNIANYTISPALAITAATYKGKTVTLTTANQTAGATAYTVTVKGVKSATNWEIPAGSNTASFYSYMLTKTGVLKFSYWSDGATGLGTAVDGLVSNNPNYPAKPDQVGAVYSFNSRDYFPDDSHENYGATMEGYLTPTESASYDFFLRSDDSSQFYISTDDKEANLVMQAEETGCCNAFMEPGASQTTAAPIALVAGKNYFVRVIYKEGGGGDYGQVAWRKVGDTTAAASLTPIPGKFLSSAVDLPFPAEGIFLTQSPAPNAKNVSPNPYVKIVHVDGKSAWTSANTTLKLDGAATTAVFTKDATVATIVYQVPSLLASESTHTLSLAYLDPAGKPATQDWSFTIFKYAGPTKDLVKSYPGLIVNNAKFTDDAGGHTAKAGDYAIDFGKGGSAWVDIKDVSYINAAAAKDELSMSMWVKRYDVSSGSAFWAQLLTAPQTGTDVRGFQAHVPWSDDTIYFDTAGCCDGSLQRISANINTFAGYTDDSFWTNKWHHFVFTKKGADKNVYIDGQLFLNGSSTDPLPTNFLELALGTDGLPGAEYMHGLLDDFAVFSTAVTAADAAKLSSGTSPKDLTGETLVAFWDFNDAKSSGGGGTASIARSGSNVTITYTGTLQSGTSVTGPWADVAGATSPYSTAASGVTQFYRTKP